MMETLEYVVLRIIREQELIIGPVAWDEAKRVVGLRVDPVVGEVRIVCDDPNIAIQQLISRYAEFFGTSVEETYKDAVEAEQKRSLK